MRVGRVDTPGQAVLRFVIALVRNGELNPVKGVFEGAHHGEDHVLVIVFLDAGEIEIRGEPPLIP